MGWSFCARADRRRGAVSVRRPGPRVHFPSQWLLAAAIVLAVSCGNGSSPPVAPTPAPNGPSDSLKAAAADRGRLVGTAVQTSFLGNPQYSTVVDREFNYLTAEYQMKWDILEPAAGASVFGP